MLWPSKHTEPRYTVLAVSAVLLRLLRMHRIVTVPDAQGRVLSYEPDNAPLFIPALTLLFGLGLIEYHKKSDSIEYIGP